MTFDTLGLLPESLRAVADQGYTEPTPVQKRAIPAILSGKDLLAGAQTGTGKTAAFVLPILQTLHATRGPGPRKVRALVVVPTRELALQVEQSVRTYGAHKPIRSAAIYGGVRMDRQVRALRGGVELVVATPGRLLDHTRQRTVDLSRVEILVLDEADRMLDMGFIPDIRRILELLPTERQTLLFSATFNSKIRRLAQDLLRNPESIDVAPRNTAAAPIRQVVHPVDKGQKRHLLTHMVRTNRVGQVLVFTRTKRGANRLAEQLSKDGINAAAIHGNKSQSQRVRALSAFKQGRSQVLVATDIAARGLDIESLPHVINFELPTVPEDYVHRIGRTGRAGQEGTAISLVSVEEQDLMHEIEKLLKAPLEREVVEGFEPRNAFRPEQGLAFGGKPGRGRKFSGQTRSYRDRSRGHGAANKGSWAEQSGASGRGSNGGQIGAGEHVSTGGRNSTGGQGGNGRQDSDGGYSAGGYSGSRAQGRPGARSSGSGRASSAARSNGAGQRSHGKGQQRQPTGEQFSMPGERISGGRSQAAWGGSGRKKQRSAQSAGSRHSKPGNSR